MKPFLPEKIKTVTVNRSNKQFLKYFFEFYDSDGFWSKPNPLTDVRDTYGYFSVLKAPTISKGWGFSSLPAESVEPEDDTTEEKDRQIKQVESLQRPLPVECVDEEFNSFFAAASLTETKADVPGCNSGKYLSLDSNV